MYIDCFVWRFFCLKVFRFLLDIIAFEEKIVNKPTNFLRVHFGWFTFSLFFPLNGDNYLQRNFSLEIKYQYTGQLLVICNQPVPCI